MKREQGIKMLILMACFMSAQFAHAGGSTWMHMDGSGYRLLYKATDSRNIAAYHAQFEEGLAKVRDFFHEGFKEDFDICIHPDRTSLDSTWQRDWNMPGFKSQCWMVASGVANRLDMISPATWERTACEHSYADTLETNRLITHELVHVFHGQNNPSPDFSGINGLDWFVEGLAVYASGQCDSLRMAEVREAVLGKQVPEELSEFWTGKLRYGLSGSVVMFLDRTYGRKAISDLLSCTTIDQLLASLHTTEKDILSSWRKYITGT